MKPKANFAHYITMVPLTDSMPSLSLRCLSPHSLMKQRKGQITTINSVLLARNYDYSAKQWNTPVLHIFKLAVTIFSLETNEGGHPKIKSHHWESADYASDYQSFLIIIGELLLIC